jgi:hypothetical protein
VTRVSSPASASHAGKSTAARRPGAHASTTSLIGRPPDHACMSTGGLRVTDRADASRRGNLALLDFQSSESARSDVGPATTLSPRRAWRRWAAYASEPRPPSWNGAGPFREALSQGFPSGGRVQDGQRRLRLRSLGPPIRQTHPKAYRGTAPPIRHKRLDNPIAEMIVAVGRITPGGVRIVSTAQDTFATRAVRGPRP